jgi:hypothetical protein
LNHSAPHPHAISNLLEPTLSGVVTALADRGSSDERYSARAAEVWTLVQSFRPRDAIDLMLTGQLIAFNELLADGTRDLLRGMVDTMKARTRSSLISLGRLSQGYVDRLEKRGILPYRTEIAVPLAKQAAAPAAREEAGTPPDHVPLAAVQAASPKAAPAGPVPHLAAAGAANAPRSGLDDTDAEPAAEPTSWLDAPYEEWVIETPADLARQAEADQEVAAATPDRSADAPRETATDAPREASAKKPREAAAEAAREVMSWYADIANSSIDALPGAVFPFPSRDESEPALEQAVAGD